MTLVIASKANIAAQTNGVAEVLIKRESFRRSAVATGGTGTITLPGLTSQRWYAYESIKIFCDSVNIPDITLYEDEALSQNFIGGSDRGDLNEWVEFPPLYTRDIVIIQWTNADANSNCFARVQRAEIEFVPVRI